MIRRILVMVVILSFSIYLAADKVNKTTEIEKVQLDYETGFVGTGMEEKAIPDLRGTPQQAKEMTLSAYNYLMENGKDMAFQQFMNTDSDFFFLDLYIFVIDMQGNMLSHGRDGSLVNRNLYDLKDSKGILFIQKFIDLMGNNDESWTDYYWRNYVTNEIEAKLTYLKKIDENTFMGCGAYYWK